MPKLPKTMPKVTKMLPKIVENGYLAAENAFCLMGGWGPHPPQWRQLKHAEVLLHINIMRRPPFRGARMTAHVSYKLLGAKSYNEIDSFP